MTLKGWQSLDSFYNAVLYFEYGRKTASLVTGLSYGQLNYLIRIIPTLLSTRVKTIGTHAILPIVKLYCLGLQGY